MRSETAASRLFSDRGRWWKAGGCLCLLAALAGGFRGREERRGMTFAGIAGGAAPPGPGAVIGPENLRVKAPGEREVLAESYGVPLRLVLPGGDAAADLSSGDWVVATARHLGGERFQVLALTRNPYRRAKLAVSGAAAVAIAGLFPFFYRWSRSAFRPRAG